MTWTVRESENYIFNFKKGSIAENNIVEIIEIQERCFKHICKVFNGRFNGKIEYYLCETPKEVGEFYGDNDPCNGFARRPNKVYGVYNEEVKCIGLHEDAHIVSYELLGIPEEVFLREGIVMFLDKGYRGRDNQTWVKYFLENNYKISLKKLLINEEFYKESPDITYPISGGFIEYLIGTYGLKCFIEFYKDKDMEIESRFLKWFDSTMEELENDFKDYIYCCSLRASSIEN